MSSVENFISFLRDKDISITVVDGRLRINAPAGALTEEIKSGLAERKAEIISCLGREPENGAMSATIKPADRSEDLPLSFSQQRLWILDKFDPGNPVYNIGERLYLDGPLDVVALQESLSEIIRRHEVLRTTFVEKNGQPVQIISAATDFNLETTDLSGITAAEKAAALEQLALEEARRPFCLDRAPLFRACLARLGESRHVLIIAMHHIIFDGWSFDVFYKELGRLYDAFSSGARSPLPDLTIQAADFASWQREYLQHEVFGSQMSYWTKRLEGIPAAVELPLSNARPVRLSYRGARLSHKIPRELIAALAELSKREGVTLYMTLLSAFLVLLYRYTGQQDIVIGTPIAGRNRVETEKLLGFFVNTLIIRCDLSGNPGFRDLLARVREIALGAYSNQDLPFEMLVEELQPKRDLSRTPFFQIMFAYQGAPADGIVLRNLEVQRKFIDINTSKFDLTLSIEETVDGDDIAAWEFASELFDPAVIEGMQEHFLTLLKAIAENPENTIREYPLLTEEARSRQLSDWNDTSAGYSASATLHQLFEQQAEKTPSATAVIIEGDQLDYAELNARANKLANRLRSLGIGPEVLVGICAERSLEMVTGLLGILKAGGAYVPLDPAYPKDRLAYMLEDADINILLTQSHLLDSLPENDCNTLCLDNCRYEIDSESSSSPAYSGSPDSLAYMIYTSGSTGAPKGVMISHAGICNRLFWMQDKYRLTRSDRVLQKTSFSFDVSVWEFFWPLLTGACLVLARPEGQKDSAYLAKLISERQITVLHFVPSMLQVFLEEDLSGCFSLRHVICSGEVLPCEIQQRFFARLDAGLHNLYGPTEASVDVTCWQCKPDSQGRTVPIGRPIANTMIYILDDCMQPVPVGVAGELFIAGVGLSRGYHNKPGLTASVFVPNPFSNIPGQLMYRTGDLARYRSDGVIEYIGRIDHQVKLRGYRIELGEIETGLMSYPEIRDALVIAREDTPGDKRLVAYCIPAGGKLVVSEIRAWLRSKLPEYMIPGAFVSLDSFPLSPNGKTDRRALPAPGSVSAGLNEAGAGEYAQPRDFLEYQLSEIWDEIFNSQWPIGIHSNFFDIGGHSLMAVKMIAQIKNIFGCEVPLASLFQAPTIAQLAEVIRKNQYRSEWSYLIPLQSSESGTPIFAIHLLDGIIFQMHMHFARHIGKYGPVYGIQARGVDGQDEPQNSMKEMAAAYLDAIFEVQPGGPYRIIGICDGATIAFEMAQQLRAANREIGLLALVVPSNPPLQVKPPRPQVIDLSRELKSHPPELRKVIDAHFLARFTYYPKKYPGDVLYVEADDDPTSQSVPVRNAWQELVGGDFHMISVPGDHNSCVRDPLIATLAERLGEYLGHNNT